MARRTKQELLSSNYYEWLNACNELRTKKKAGTKLTATEKEILRTVPTPESPYVQRDATAVPGKDAKQKTARRSAKAAVSPTSFDATVEWKTAGGKFLCAVHNTPFSDEQCLLFCKSEDCPFFEKGYFRAHGVKF